MIYEIENDPLRFGTDAGSQERRDLFQFLGDKDIVIYPAGENGRQLYQSLKKADYNVTAFVDRNAHKIDPIDGIDVQSPDYIEKLGKDAAIVIAANFATNYNEILESSEQSSPFSWKLNGQQLNRLLKSKTCISRLEDGQDFDLIECERCGFERSECSIATKYLKHVGLHDEDKYGANCREFDWFGYIVSQKCTLKCQHCCEHVPYLNGKGFTSVEQIVADVKKLADSSHFLNFVELIGGEPLLHPKIEELLEELLKIENIGYIKSFTNGTVVPSDELCRIMKNSRFMLQVSNYEQSTTGKLLENIFKTRAKLAEEGINYVHTPDFEWLDFTSFEHHEASQEYLEEAFDNCFLKNCHRVYQGILYRCPHQYAGHHTGDLEVPGDEMVEIHTMGTDELSNSLRDFEHLKYIEACSKCELAFNPTVVPAGLQLSARAGST